MNKIYYKAGYKYQTVADFDIQTPIRQSAVCTTEHLALRPSGQLTIFAGYASDGPSGPTVDTRNFIRDAIVHDAFYELMRRKLLSLAWREDVDAFFRASLRDAGMSRFRSWYVWRAVRSFADSNAAPRNAKPICSAP